MDGTTSSPIPAANTTPSIMSLAGWTSISATATSYSSTSATTNGPASGRTCSAAPERISPPGRASTRTNWGTTLDDVYTFTPTLVLNVRLNWTRFIEAYNNNSSGFDITSLGFPASLAAAAQEALLPRISFNAFTALGNAGAAPTDGRCFPGFFHGHEGRGQSQPEDGRRPAALPAERFG